MLKESVQVGPAGVPVFCFAMFKKQSDLWDIRVFREKVLSSVFRLTEFITRLLNY